MSTVVNYVWMDRNPAEPQQIPTYLFYRVQENAKRYSTTAFYLWTESEEAHKPYVMPTNVTAHRLSEIPGFSDIPGMAFIGGDAIWCKVDKVRLIVLEHVLKKSKCDTAIYSDFDTPDVSVDSPALLARLDQYGVALAGTMRGDGTLNNTWENGYFAFRRTNIALLSYVTGQLYGAKGGVYSATSRAFTDWVTQQPQRRSRRHDRFPSEWRIKVASIPLLYVSGWRNDIHFRAKTVADETVKRAAIVSGVKISVLLKKAPKVPTNAWINRHMAAVHANKATHNFY